MAGKEEAVVVEVVRALVRVVVAREVGTWVAVGTVAEARAAAKEEEARATVDVVEEASVAAVMAPAESVMAAGAATVLGSMGVVVEEGEMAAAEMGEVVAQVAEV